MIEPGKYSSLNPIGDPNSDSSANPSNWSNSREKRVLDMLLSFGLLVILSPAMIVIAVAIKLQSLSSPVLFRQERLGLTGKLFKILKFRTMEHRIDTSGGHTTHFDDPRVTALGRFLRRWKLDELPQLLNVLLGQMSFVGPRPRVAQQVQDPAMLLVKPGITSPATLAFRNEEVLWRGLSHGQIDIFYSEVVAPVKINLDLDYLKEASLWNDSKLILLTALSVFRKESRYCFADRKQVIRLSQGEWSGDEEGSSAEVALAGSD